MAAADPTICFSRSRQLWQQRWLHQTHCIRTGWLPCHLWPGDLCTNHASNCCLPVSMLWRLRDSRANAKTCRTKYRVLNVQCAGAHLAAPLHEQVGPVRPVLSGQPDEDPTNARPWGTRRGRRTLGCSMIGRLPRASSNAIEMKEEQRIGVGKIRVCRRWKGKK
jgi:hypothetical protein